MKHARPLLLAASALALFISACSQPADVRAPSLERRAEALRAVMSGQLVVFGGTKALKVAEEFHAAIANMKSKVASNRP